MLAMSLKEMFQGKKCGALILQRSLCVKSIKLLCKMRPASQIFIRETEKPRLKEEKKKKQASKTGQPLSSSSCMQRLSLL